MSAKLNFEEKLINTGVSWCLLRSLEVITTEEYLKRLHSDPADTPPPLDTSPSKDAMEIKAKRMKR